ncbi:MAG: T9SS type A sorting domain-containing protein [Candidatus Aegiribacteria sp.]|nr:T9SS type A sorting domain-containing protein [Candidatus Aegiribacteria sp.]
MIKCLVPILLVGVCTANVDMAPLHFMGNDYLYVSWIDDSGDARVARYEETTPVAEATFHDRTMASVAICLDDTDTPNVMLITSMDDTFCTDTLYSLWFVLLDVQDQVFFEGMYTEHAQYGLIRHHHPLYDGLIAGYYYTCLSSGTDFYWFMQNYSINSGQIDPGTLLYEETPYPLEDASEYFPFRMVGPVACQDSRAIFATDKFNGGGWGYPGYTLLMTLSHNPPIDPVYLLCDTLTSAPDTLPCDPCIMAMGSCSDRGLLLWVDEWGANHFSSYNCSEPAPVSTEAYSWAYPDNSNPCAMSCNPDDEGLLLAWYRNDEIRCRHFLNVWNDFDHIIRTSTGLVLEGDIAVCSVKDGYWIAWLENGSDAEYPELEFVLRDSITSIDPSVSSPLEYNLRVFPNPFSETLSILVEGLEGSASLRIYDLAGHLVHRSFSFESSTFSWNFADRPSGTYIVTVSSDDFTSSRRVVLIN